MKIRPLSSLKGAKNIGATIEQHLNEIGVFSLADLAQLTPAVAYKTMCARHPNKSFPVCYYLYSLQGALLDLHWDELPQKLKNDLKKAVGK